MRRLSSLFAVLFLASLFLYSSAAHADTIYQVAGTIESIGNNTCTPAPCDVIIHYSYTLDAFSNNFNYAVTNQTVSGGGSVGSVFSLGSWNDLFGAEGFIPIHDAAGDEVDLLIDLEINQFFAEWYKCASLTCFDGFLPPSVQANWPSGPPAINVGFQGADPFTMVQTVTTPEASTGLMLLSGITFLFFWRRRFSRLAPLRLQPTR